MNTKHIYSIALNTNHYINPLTIDNIVREILKEYNNPSRIKSISYINDWCIYTTTLKEIKNTVSEKYDDYIKINWYP